jgi:hypothetical protein
MKKIYALARVAGISEKEVTPLRKEYFRLLRQELENREREIFVEETMKTLAAKGYSLLDSKGEKVIPKLQPGNTYYLGGINSDYRIKCDVGDDYELKLQQMRVTSSRQEALAPISDYQKAVEKEEGEKWCAILKDIASKLASSDVEVDRVVLREPGEKIPVIVDSSRPKKAEDVVTKPVDRTREI